MFILTRDTVYSAGLVLLSIFMVLGNALVYGTDTPRRRAQLFVLFIGVVFTLYGIFFSPVRLKVIRQTAFKFLKIWLSVLALLLLRGFIKGVTELDVYSILNLTISSMWLTLSIMVMIETPTLMDFGRQRDPIQFNKLFWFFLAIGLFLVLKGWWVGPNAKEVFNAFGGSQTLTGGSALILAWLSLWLFAGPLSYILTSLFFFLVIMSTSRIAVLLACLFLFILWWSQGFKRFAAASSIFLTLFVAPFFFTSSYFPYRTEKSQAEFYRTEYFARYVRFLRLIPFTQEGEILSKQASDIIKYTETAPKQAEEDLSLIALALKTKEERGTLFKNTIERLKGSPFGYWPTHFQSIIELDCNPGVKCEYPHNIFLETSFYHGWLAGLILLAGVALMLWQIMRALKSKFSVESTILGIGFFVHITMLQFYGGIFDSVTALIFGLFWLARTDESY